MFINYKNQPDSIVKYARHNVYYFKIEGGNIDEETVEAFGDEWSKFGNFSDDEIESLAKTHYFDIVNAEFITGKRLLDVGCGTGRWTKYAAKYALTVDAVDPSKAIISAANLLKNCTNVRLARAAVDSLPFENESFDFVFSLGVLHHIPNTASAMQQCIYKLKKGGYFLTYLYYNLDNRKALFIYFFYLSNSARKLIKSLPSGIKNFICDLMAIIVYYPIILIASFIKTIGMPALAKKIPLHFYVGKTFNVIRNDARDRFGTPLEQRFSKAEIKQMMESCGLTDIVFSDNEPYWHAIGKKK